MQRLFSMLPDGGPGWGLAILRLTLIASLYLDQARHLVFPSSSVLFAVLVILSIFLALGLLTMYAAALSCLIKLGILLPTAGIGGATAVFVVLISAAIVLLGPGAYSIDARLFGRRIVVQYPSRSEDP